MAKRKRPLAEDIPSDAFKTAKTDTKPASKPPASTAYFQIVAGCYDKTLHGIIATVKSGEEGAQGSEVSNINFYDNFLFNAHSSAIRCLAISPSGSTSAAKVTLATGGTDERVNIYQLDASAPSEEASIVRLGGKTLENPKNKELGSLLHHSFSINALHFPSKGKLLSAAGDNTVAVTRTRDWTVLSTIKAPAPRVVGRPSGDTAGPGDVPMGINDFAVHPSKKLMISVGRGERCMRLWNLVTGKKAGVLNFERDVLIAVGEGKWSRGEGLKVEWSPHGDEFAVAFERGVVVFSMECEPKGIIQSTPLSKVHQMRYIIDQQSEDVHLAISTEDGRVIIYSTTGSVVCTDPGKPPSLQALGQLGGQVTGFRERVKDFEVLLDTRGGNNRGYMVFTGSSDGNIRIWNLRKGDLSSNNLKTPSQSLLQNKQNSTHNGDEVAKDNRDSAIPQIGTLLGVYNTSSRITCLRVFEMTPPAPNAEDSAGQRSHVVKPKGDADGVPAAGSDPLHQGGSESASGRVPDDDFEGFD